MKIRHVLMRHILCTITMGLAVLGSGSSARGSVVRQLSHTLGGYPRPGVLDDAGTMVITNAPVDPLGGNPQHKWQIFKFDPVTGAAQQLGNFRQGVADTPFAVSVSDDGQWIAFISSSDPTGQNHDASPEAFVMKVDGTALLQITDDPAPNAGSVASLAMSGSGNRVVYVSNSNPLGSNPTHSNQVFIVDRDGTNTRQLSASSLESSIGSPPSISDDGQKIAFSCKANLTGGNADLGYEIFVVMADGTGLRQLTSSSLASYVSQAPAISGNGAKVAFESKGDLVPSNNADHGFEVYVANWDGTGLAQLTQSSREARYPSMADDGVTLAFLSNMSSGGLNSDLNYEIWKIRTDGTGLALITSVVDFGPTNHADGTPVISGGGTRCAFLYSGTLPPSTLNPDKGLELYAKDVVGGTPRQLTATLQIHSFNPQISDDGNTMVFVSNDDPFGTNSNHTDEIFRINPDGTGLTQITFDTKAYAISLSPDGSFISFVVTGSGHYADLFKVRTDGTGLTQLTSGSYANYYSGIAANNSWIVFFSNGNYTGQNVDQSTEVFSIKPDGTNLRQLSNSPGYNAYYPTVDASGTWVAFGSYGDLTGGNPDHSQEVFRVRTDGTGLQQITADPVGGTGTPTISGAGDLLAYSSQYDPLGTNPEHNSEIFLWRASTGMPQQLTFTDSHASTRASITRDGAYIYFYSTAELVEDDDDYTSDLYRIVVATGAIERVGARRGITYIAKLPAFQVYFPAVNATGSRCLVSAEGDLTGDNGDHLEEVWLIDRAASSTISVSASAPTVVSWDHESGPIRYDVIRGTVSNMGPGGGGTVNLGPVVCLDDDSPINDTVGYEDTVQPSAGQAFFYAYRGSDGLDAPAGTYGTGSGGGLRVPFSGDCTP